MPNNFPHAKLVVSPFFCSDDLPIGPVGRWGRGGAYRIGPFARPARDRAVGRRNGTGNDFGPERTPISVPNEHRFRSGAVG